MIEYRNVRPASVIGPLGEILTLESLPPGNTTRWVARRKAEVVAAVDGGLITVDEVLRRYELSLEEFISWRRAMDRAGISGLRVASAQQNRDLRKQQHPMRRQIGDDLVIHRREDRVERREERPEREVVRPELHLV